MYTVGFIIYYAFSVYMFILMMRVVLDWISILSRDWRPKGAILVIANFVYSLTDPPVRFFGRLIPPLRIGGIALDLGFLVLFILLIVGQRLCVWLFFNVLA
ncbi:MAG: YggT family protein [Mobiluncus porci]|uniref:YggT family protein n=1 Tax=Mobiluncus porci TaxID=2652278 RepID=A0A7K0K4X8_9ACTO|nr:MULTISPECIES: YggT family protein [Mobiluncus]MCI6584970.1 YggT family protein [Mobiluncus sp.]MDD7542294.1 YggT family protein [Mobiluncus porci]MDY5749093.1 YggT family protein [Mobiluncus porci]MST50488.1 YggT family protein [Mobiluncus porci]